MKITKEEAKELLVCIKMYYGFKRILPLQPLYKLTSLEKKLKDIANIKEFEDKIKSYKELSEDENTAICLANIDEW